MIDNLDLLDKKILIWVHQNCSNSVFDVIMPKITDQNNWIIFIALLTFCLAFRLGKKGKIALSLLIISLALTDMFCAQVLKPYFERLRPSHVNLEGLNLLVSKGGKWSMPSNHAANIFSFAVILSYFYNSFKYLIFGLAFTIAFSRMYVGVHYLGDIIVGASVGYCLSWFVLTLWVILKMRELKRGKTWVWYQKDPPIFKT